MAELFPIGHMAEFFPIVVSRPFLIGIIGSFFSKRLDLSKYYGVPDIFLFSLILVSNL